MYIYINMDVDYPNTFEFYIGSEFKPFPIAKIGNLINLNWNLKKMDNEDIIWFKGIIIHENDRNENLEKWKLLDKSNKPAVSNFVRNIKYTVWFPSDNTYVPDLALNQIYFQHNAMQYIKDPQLVANIKMEMLEEIEIEDVDVYNKLFDKSQIAAAGEIIITKLNNKMSSYTGTTQDILDYQYLMNALGILIRNSITITKDGIQEQEDQFAIEHEAEIKNAALGLILLNPKDPTGYINEENRDISAIVQTIPQNQSNLPIVTVPPNPQFDDSVSVTVSYNDASKNIVIKKTNTTTIIHEEPLTNLLMILGLTITGASDTQPFIKEQALLRYMDILKDGKVNPSAVEKIVKLFIKYFGNELNAHKHQVATEHGVTTTDVKDLFNVLKQKITEHNTGFGKIRTETWTKTDGSIKKMTLPKIGVVFQESGLGPKEFLNMDFYGYNLATDIIDPAGRVTADKLENVTIPKPCFFPKSQPIIFEESFFSLFGFTNTSLLSQRTGATDYNYTDYSYNLNIDGTIITQSIINTNGNPKYFIGNKDKNKIILGQPLTGGSPSKKSQTKKSQTKKSQTKKFITKKSQTKKSQTKKSQTKKSISFKLKNDKTQKIQPSDKENYALVISKELGDVLQLLFIYIWKLITKYQDYLFATCDHEVYIMAQSLGVNCVLTNQKDDAKLGYIEYFNTNDDPKLIIIYIYRSINNILFDNQRFIWDLNDIKDNPAKYNIYHHSDKSKKLIIPAAFYNFVIHDLSRIQELLRQVKKTKMTELISGYQTGLLKINSETINQVLVMFKQTYTFYKFIDKNSSEFRDTTHYTPLKALFPNIDYKLPNYSKQLIINLINISVVPNLDVIITNLVNKSVSKKPTTLGIAKKKSQKKGGAKDINLDQGGNTELLYIYLYDTIYRKLLQLGLENLFEQYKFLLLYEFNYLNEVYYSNDDGSRDKLDYLIYYLTCYLANRDVTQLNIEIKTLKSQLPEFPEDYSDIIKDAIKNMTLKTIISDSPIEKVKSRPVLSQIKENSLSKSRFKSTRKSSPISLTGRKRTLKRKYPLFRESDLERTSPLLKSQRYIR